MSLSMSDALDELTYDVEEDGVLVRRQLERVVLGGGAWATVMFFYQELDRTTGTFAAPKISVVRFKKLRGAYRKHSAFTLASVEQARALTETFERWFDKMEATAPEENEEKEGADEGHSDEGHSDDARADAFDARDEAEG